MNRPTPWEYAPLSSTGFGSRLMLHTLRAHCARLMLAGAPRGRRRPGVEV